MQSDLFAQAKFEDKVREKSQRLLRIKEIIVWEAFRGRLDSIWRKNGSVFGRPPMDSIRMFKLLVLQKISGNLSDEQMEFQIIDRDSFKIFLDIINFQQVPDRKTIWAYRNILGQVKTEGCTAFDNLFKELTEQVASMGYRLEEGDTKIIDAQIVEVPIRRDKRGEKGIIENGGIPEDWSEAKARQKDRDADWKKKGDKSYFDYENHARVDSKSKLIEGYTVTAVSVHDSKETFNLINKEDEGKELYADSAYRSAEIESKLAKMGIESQIHEKGYKNKPLTEAQKELNKKKSKTRARVEHAFAGLEESCGSFIRSIGLERAKLQIGLNNFVYNLRRVEFLFRSGFLKRVESSQGF
jgi:IS5 family transposase